MTLEIIKLGWWKHRRESPAYYYVHWKLDIECDAFNNYLSVSYAISAIPQIIVLFSVLVPKDVEPSFLLSLPVFQPKSISPHASISISCTASTCNYIWAILESVLALCIYVFSCNNLYENAMGLFSLMLFEFKSDNTAFSSYRVHMLYLVLDVLDQETQQGCV